MHAAVLLPGRLVHYAVSTCGYTDLSTALPIAISHTDCNGFLFFLTLVHPGYFRRLLWYVASRIDPVLDSGAHGNPNAALCVVGRGYQGCYAPVHPVISVRRH